MWWMVLAAIVIIVAAMVVARRRGTGGSYDSMRTAGNGEHMMGVEMSRHNDSGSTGGAGL